MKFIHAADLHLDTPFASIKNYSKQLQNNLKKSTYTAATKVFDTAIREKVDFVILAGDTYDNTERSLTAQDFLKNQFTRLKENGISVYMIYGNHDYFRSDFSTISFPENVHIFSENIQTETLESHDGLKVGITGFSYYQQHISANVVSNYPERGSFDYQIGILHGGIGDVNYAPFSVNELLTKRYDYWALGHIHKRQVLSENPFIIYPGDTQGRKQNETGKKGFYLVTVLNKNTSVDFVESSSYIWSKDVIEANESDTVGKLNKKIADKIPVDTPELLTLIVNNAQKLNKDVIRAIDRGDVLLHFSEIDGTAALYKLVLKFNNPQQLAEIDQKYWDESAQNIFDLDDIKELDQKLYNVDVIREHILENGFLNRVKDSTSSVINKKFIGEEQ